MISKKTKYALKALTALAEKAGNSDGPMLIAELAEQERIPRKFLEVILLDLKNRGVLQSRMGKGGGYLLAKPTSEIKIGMVVRALEGPLAPFPCLSKTAYERCEECADELHCGIRLTFKDAHEASMHILDNTSLQDMVEKATASQKSMMYFI